MAGATVRAGLPHGAVTFHHIADLQVRDAVMKLNENVLALARRLAAAEAKLKEIERRS